MPHPDYLGNILTHRQIVEWILYDSLSPFGDERADYRQAVTSALLVNVNRGKNSKAASPLDFMPFSKWKKLQPQSIKEQKAVIANIMASRGIFAKTAKTAKTAKKAKKKTPKKGKDK